MRKKAVITGLGAITPIGNDLDTIWNNLKNGISAGTRVTKFDVTDFTSQIATEVKDFDVSLYIDKKKARRMDLFTQYALAGAKLAMEDSNLLSYDYDPTRASVILGSGIGGINTICEQYDRLTKHGPKRISPFLIPMLIVNMAPGEIAIQYNCKGPNYGVVTACASANNALFEALKLIQYDLADIVITGGAEAALTPLGYGGFCSMKALTTRNDDPATASRPFDKDRDGFLMGEGSGILIIESEEHAKNRGAHIYAELAGAGLTCDANHITAPDPEGDGAARAMQLAIDDAGISPADIDYINAHGTSTPLNDKFETKAIKTVFKDYAEKVSISSTKSMHGHLLGATGGIEGIACILAINNSFIPPTINYTTPDPECDLDYTPNEGKNKEINYAISNTLGFGGHNSVIIFKKYED